MLYDDSLVQGLEGKANVESHLNSILSYSQYWMRHTTLEIKFELKMESLHMAGINIKQEFTGDSSWFAGGNDVHNFIHHDNEFPYTTTYPNFPVCDRYSFGIGIGRYIGIGIVIGIGRYRFLYR